MIVTIWCHDKILRPREGVSASARGLDGCSWVKMLPGAGGIIDSCFYKYSLYIMSDVDVCM